jgi:hypothetical protein
MTARPMTSKFNGIARLPMRLTLFYVAATLFVFAFGPFDWPVDNWPMLLGFMAAAVLALWLGYRFAVARPATAAATDNWTRIILFGSLISAIILFVTAPVYTGRMPWEVLGALRDQGAAYDAMQDQLELTAGSRGPVALARVLTWPLVFAVIPLGILHWREMRTRLRMLVLMTLCSLLVSSILRGTDRESADLMAMIGGAGVVLVARTMVHEELTLRQALNRFRFAAMIVVILMAAAVVLFAARKEERVATTSALCIAQSEQEPTGFCADFDHPLFALFGLDDSHRFAASMAAAYFSQGYYGLSLALDLPDFHSTLGLGNAPFAMAAYTSLTGDEVLYQGSYTYRMREAGWSDEHQWSTMFPWLANDVSFPGVLLLMLLIGAGFGASWRDAVFGRNDRAAVVFVVFAIMMGYLPANSQITLAPDHVFALLIWCLWWRWGTPRARHETIAAPLA